MSFVLDNAVALAWCFEDEQTPAVMDLLDRVAETGANAPALWPLEALNGLLMAERRKRIDSQRRVRLMAFLRDLPIVLDLDTPERVRVETIRLAERFKLTVYDAAYLERAQRHRLPIASLDKPLRTAAATIGIETLGISA